MVVLRMNLYQEVTLSMEKVGEPWFRGSSQVLGIGFMFMKGLVYISCNTDKKMLTIYQH